MPLKALDANVYLVRRMRCDESLNLFVTTDFKHYQPVSRNYPERDYNWIKDELVNWKLPNGRISQGILYKPENFDSTKKYPIIFDYYEKRSDELNKYIVPELAGDRINIPFYVSNGYLVFVPDIYYEPGKNGQGVVNAVVSAAKYLSCFSWVDPGKMGLQGHSFGGWETNYLVTHSHTFAAACEAAGPTDHISMYGEVLLGSGEITQDVFEMYNQGSPYGIGVTPWTAPERYMENSPVFFVDSITTPLLMMQGRLDEHTPYEQAMELFTDMRRAGKKVWLLDYENGGHGLFGNDARDYVLRMRQFFDYYLKGALPPVWMTRGVPVSKKGEENGLELDRSGAKP
jgi:dipeptidyl aminopeptidase/acylaminoacyl peptidase